MLSSRRRRGCADHPIVFGICALLRALKQRESDLEDVNHPNFGLGLR